MLYYDIIITNHDGTTEEAHLTREEIRYLEVEDVEVVNISNENPMEDKV